MKRHVMRASQAGQASVEYLIITAALALALFVPFENGHSAAELLAFAFRNFFRGFSFLVSVL